ncbi:MAG: hypothetical protein LBR95_01325 [Azoarcus sp.]|jgi:hypothetical protein|nr:hypothetical protein [Azoarcus sp.]
MKKAVPWSRLEVLMEPHYPKKGNVSAIAKRQKTSQALRLNPAPQGAMSSKLSAPEMHGADGYHQNLPKVVLRAVARTARVFKLMELFHQIASTCAHIAHPKNKSRYVLVQVYETAL